MDDPFPNITYYAGQTHDIRHLSDYVAGTHQVPKVRNASSLALLADVGLQELESHASDIYNTLLITIPPKDICLTCEGIAVTQSFGPQGEYFWKHRWAYDTNQMRQVWLQQSFRLAAPFDAILSEHLPAIHRSTLLLDHPVDLRIWADRAKKHFSPQALRFHVISQRITIQYNADLHWALTPNTLTLHSNASTDQQANGGGASFQDMQAAWEHISGFLPTHG